MKLFSQGFYDHPPELPNSTVLPNTSDEKTMTEKTSINHDKKKLGKYTKETVVSLLPMFPYKNLYYLQLVWVFFPFRKKNFHIKNVACSINYAYCVTLIDSYYKM